MKLKNKKTGEIRNAVDIDMYTDSVCLKVSYGEFDNETIEYHSLAELNEEWEDVPEEPKEYWYVSCDGRALKATTDEDDYNEKHISGHKEIGNYFETKEEAELAVRKLEAWKRLKDKGFRFNRWTIPEEPKTPHIKLVIEAEMDVPDSPYDLDLLFGGEE